MESSVFGEHGSGIRKRTRLWGLGAEFPVKQGKNRCYGAGGEGMAPSSQSTTDGEPHAEAECEQIPRRDHRDEPVELAGGGDRSGPQA